MSQPRYKVGDVVEFRMPLFPRSWAHGRIARVVTVADGKHPGEDSYMYMVRADRGNAYVSEKDLRTSVAAWNEEGI